MRDKLINKKFVIIVIALVFLLTMGFSYAWWRLSFAQDKANTAISKCLKLELANQANEINLTNMYPISDEEGRALTPLTFTLKNTCSMSAKYTLNLEMLEGTTLNSNYLAVLVNNKDIKLLSSYNTATTVIKGSTESRTFDTGVLQANSSKDYSISIWMDKSVTLSDDAQNKVFKSKVVVDASAVETVTDRIIAQLDTTGACPTINDDGTIKVSKDGYYCLSLKQGYNVLEGSNTILEMNVYVNDAKLVDLSTQVTLSKDLKHTYSTGSVTMRLTTSDKIKVTTKWSNCNIKIDNNSALQITKYLDCKEDLDFGILDSDMFPYVGQARVGTARLMVDFGNGNNDSDTKTYELPLVDVAAVDIAKLKNME